MLGSWANIQDAVLTVSNNRHRTVTTRCSFFFIPAALDVTNGENDTADFLFSFVRATRG
jgi:hypothetical protein